MNRIRTADIIPFPSHSGETSAGMGPGEGAERLRRALAALDAAVSQQREAVQQWRMALGGLRSNARELHASLRQYDTSLGSLRSQFAAMGHTTRGPEAWAGAAMTHGDEALPPQPK